MILYEFNFKTFYYQLLQITHIMNCLISDKKSHDKRLQLEKFFEIDLLRLKHFPVFEHEELTTFDES